MAVAAIIVLELADSQLARYSQQCFLQPAAVTMPKSETAPLGDRKRIVRPHQGRQAVEAARVAADRVAMAGPRFWREGTTRAWAQRIDATTGIDAKSPL